MADVEALGAACSAPPSQAGRPLDIIVPRLIELARTHPEARFRELALKSLNPFIYSQSVALFTQVDEFIAVRVLGWPRCRAGRSRRRGDVRVHPV